MYVSIKLCIYISNEKVPWAHREQMKRMKSKVAQLEEQVQEQELALTRLEAERARAIQYLYSQKSSLECFLHSKYTRVLPFKSLLNSRIMTLKNGQEPR